MTPFKPNPDHLSAARSFRFARNCLMRAKEFPWMTEREQVSAAQWRESGMHWRRMAAFERPNEIWRTKPDLSWECELAIMLTRLNALTEEVE